MTTPTATQALDSATEPFRRSDLAIVRFAEFQRLWSAYHAALAVDTFRMTQEQREQNEIEVAEAFQALHRLSQEGM